METVQKGKLKIFFGYCAGCGKTYAMLEAAQAKKKEGIDVVVGYIEPHDRKETMALLNGLETLPLMSITYRNRDRQEFDLDAAIQRHPALLLVDECAHTNLHGSRHQKRYSDIEELLRNGIDVYTTLNVQHLESMHDLIEGITHIEVGERVPDKILKESDQIEFIDIDPKELRERLKQGKIYHQNQARLALDHFFLNDNLIALREIAMRLCADHMNEQIAIQNKPFTKEHILVCLSPSPSNAHVIRTAARMASAFQADFSAVYIETRESDPMSSKQLEKLEENRSLAAHFSCNIVALYGESIAPSIYEYARAAGVSKVVIGRSPRRNTLFTKPNLIDELSQLDCPFDIYVIPNKYPKQTYKKSFPSFHINTHDTWITLVLFLGATLLGFLFKAQQINESNIIMLYLGMVYLISYFTSSKFYGLLSSLCAVLSFNFFFTVPTLSLQAYDSSYFFTFFLMFLVALTTSTLTRKVKQQSTINAMQAHRFKILLETSQLLQSAQTLADIAKVACQQLNKLLDHTIIIYPIFEDRLQLPFLYQTTIDEEEENALLTQNEEMVARWVLKNNKKAGATTNTLSAAKGFYLAVRKNNSIYAIVGIAMIDGEVLPPFERSILTTMLNEIALAMDALIKVKRKQAI